MTKSVRTYKHIKAEIENLQQEAELLRRSEAADVLEDVRNKIRDFGFTERDIFGSKRNSRNSLNSGVKKYRDPQTGATWSGRGRPPEWIVNAKNRDHFLMRQSQLRSAKSAVNGDRVDPESNDISGKPYKNKE